MMKLIGISACFGLFILLFSFTAQAAPMYYLNLDADSPSVNIGETFTVQVLAEKPEAITADLMEFYFELDFNTDIVEALDVDLEDYLPSPNMVLIEQIGPSYVYFGAKVNSTPHSSSGSTGVLASITFKVINFGQSSFDISKITLSGEDGYIYNMNGFPNRYVSVESTSVEVNQPTPEPGTMLLFGIGLVGFSFFGRKKHFKKLF